MAQGTSAWAEPPKFAPSAGTVICEPAGSGEGYWVGAPGVFYDAETQETYLSYRIRRPRGVEPDRGAETVLTVSRDGFDFKTIWQGHKDQLNSASIERCAIGRLDDGGWVLTISYVDPADGRWRIDTVSADRPDNFDLAKRQTALTAAALGVEGVKDPYIFRVGGMRHMLASFAFTAAESSHEQLHGTLDAFNTGRIVSATGLAVSPDGLNWDWQGAVFAPNSENQGKWDGYCRRIGCLLRRDGLWLGLYDGSADVSENYEERLGIAYSADLRSFYNTTPDRPWLTTPQGHGALRYFDAIPLRDKTRLYYEMATPEGHHDLRMIEV